MIVAGKSTFVMPYYSCPALSRHASTLLDTALVKRELDEYLILVHLQVGMHDVLLLSRV